MTHEQAIEILDDNYTAINTHGHYTEEEEVEALQMAIKALEQQPCDDAISRHEVLSIIECHKNIDGNDAIVWIEKEIGELPSVTPQPKVGKWLEKEVNSDKVIEEWQSARCSVCDKYHTTPYMYYFSHYKYCPNCGARMEVSERMSNLEKAKEIVKAYYSVADCGIFDSRNLVGDAMTTIYDGEGLTIDICYGYAYFEVFGLSDAEFEELDKYYHSLRRK